MKHYIRHSIPDRLIQYILMLYCGLHSYVNFTKYCKQFEYQRKV